MGPSAAMKILKTWLNGWDSSHRIHEDTILRCLLGCDIERDSLNLHVKCPHLYAFSAFFFYECSEDPLVRLGLLGLSRSALAAVGCAFSAYHALKAKARAGLI